MRTQRLSNGTDIIVFDFETTGFSPYNNEIIEIGAWHFRDGVATGKFERRIKPDRYVPADVMRLTGITNEALEGCDPIDVVLPEFIDFIGEYDLMGYNIDFDYRFLCVKSKALGFDVTLNGQRRGIDVLKTVKKTFNFKSNKLGDVAREMGIPCDTGLHTAIFDAYITKQVYDRCPKETPTLLDKTKYGKPVIKDTLEW